MSCHHIDFVTFDLAAESLHGLALDDPFAELRGHDLGVVGIKIQPLSDLFIRKIQSHEVETENPDPQWLVMAGEDRSGQVVEESLTRETPVTLPFGLGRIVALPGDLSGVAMGTGDTLSLAQLSNRLKALAVVDEVPDGDHDS